MCTKILSLFCIILTIPVYSLNQIIIKFKPSAIQRLQLKNNTISQKSLNAELMKPFSETQIKFINQTANSNFFERNAIATGAHVLDSDNPIPPKELDRIIAKLSKLNNVEYVELNKFYHTTSLNNDYDDFQWDMKYTTKGDSAGLNSSISPTVYGDNFENLLKIWRTIFTAHNYVDPGFGVRVGVIDTGYTNNYNITGQLQSINPNESLFGYDFISDCRIAGTCTPNTPNSKAMRNPVPNGIDLGDFLTQEMINNSNNFFSDCPVSTNSSWHGSHVTGTIVGIKHNTPYYLLGGAPGALVEPIRVLGKCGGTTQDIANGIMWAANLHPNIINLYPVQVINMSLGSSGVCSGVIADAIKQVIQLDPKIIFVIAAGNDSGDIKHASPANCPNVISVASTSPLNNLSFFSNYGNTSISATGGDQYPYMTTSENSDIALQYIYKSGIYSSVWCSHQEYNIKDGSCWKYYNGTSMATPHVSALVADIISYIKIGPKILNRNWNTGIITNILQKSANNYYDKCNNKGFFAKQHNVGGCVATGRINAESALLLTKTMYSQ